MVRHDALAVHIQACMLCRHVSASDLKGAIYWQAVTGRTRPKADPCEPAKDDEWRFPS